MSSEANSARMPIGQTLSEARRRLGMEIAEAEEQTKIRARYIRAMEHEEWEVLPGATYTRAFIRTYAQILGLDGEMLADQYRRTYDEPISAGLSAEPLLERRRPQRPSSRGPLIVALGIGLIAVLLLLGIFAGDDDGGDPPEPAGSSPGETEDGGERRSKQEPGQASGGLEPISIRLSVASDTRICVIGDQGPLIDAQLIPAGAEESFDDSKRYRVDIEAGALEIRSGGSSQAVRTDQPTSYDVDARGIREISYPGPGCQ